MRTELVESVGLALRRPRVPKVCQRVPSRVCYVQIGVASNLWVRMVEKIGKGLAGDFGFRVLTEKGHGSLWKEEIGRGYAGQRCKTFVPKSRECWLGEQKDWTVTCGNLCQLRKERRGVGANSAENGGRFACKVDVTRGAPAGNSATKTSGQYCHGAEDVVVPTVVTDASQEQREVIRGENNQGFVGLCAVLNREPLGHCAAFVRGLSRDENCHEQGDDGEGCEYRERRPLSHGVILEERVSCGNFVPE